MHLSEWKTERERERVRDIVLYINWEEPTEYALGSSTKCISFTQTQFSLCNRHWYACTLAHRSNWSVRNLGGCSHCVKACAFCVWHSMGQEPVSTSHVEKANVCKNYMPLIFLCFPLFVSLVEARPLIPHSPLASSSEACQPRIIHSI